MTRPELEAYCAAHAAAIHVRAIADDGHFHNVAFADLSETQRARWLGYWEYNGMTPHRIVEPSVMVGGDPVLLRKAGMDVPGVSLFPCQKCGRAVTLTSSSQRLALGDPTPVVEVHAGPHGPTFEDKGRVESDGAAVLCFWCAFADHPDILAKLNEALAD